MLMGITVLDFTMLLPGPHASSRLRDLGATVWKIEPPGGDPARWTGPLNDGVGVVFQFHADGKTLREVDLTSMDGKALVREMAVDADVVLEGFRPGVAARLGIDYDTLAVVNPRLIYCSLTGYGQTGPLAAQAGHDLNYQALSGLLSLSEHASGGPAVPVVQWADLIGGEAAVTAILAALVDRERTGRGAFFGHLDDRCLKTSVDALYGRLAADRGAGICRAVRAGGLLSSIPHPRWTVDGACRIGA